MSKGIDMQMRIEPMDPIVLPIIIASGKRKREIDSLLDTGATYLVITTEDAIDLGYDLAVAPRFPVVTANGIVEAPLILLESVQLGPYTVRNVSTLSLNMAGDRVSSLLGLSVLSQLKICIDAKNGLLTVEDC